MSASLSPPWARVERLALLRLERSAEATPYPSLCVGDWLQNHTAVGASDPLWASLIGQDGIEMSPSVFKDGPALWANGTEIVHCDGDQVLDIRLTRVLVRARRAELCAGPRVRLRRSSVGDWIEVELSDPADEGFLLALMQEAAQALKAGPGATTRSPQTGAALKRRRRLH